MIKLKYKTLDFNGLTIYYSKYRMNRNIRLTIDGKQNIKLTCPYYISDVEIFSFLKDKESWIKKTLSKIGNATNLAKLPKLGKKEKDMLQLRINNFMQKYEILLKTKVNNFSIRKMKTLWGSCSFREKTIRFNSYLYYMSDYFLEYIVLHEMTHLFIQNHSKEFYNMIKKYMPDYKERWSEHKKVSLS